MPRKKSRIAEARARQRRYRKVVGRARGTRRDVGPLDYKDVNQLLKFCSQQGKLLSRKRSGFTAKQQRELKNAVKYARFVGFLSYSG